MPKLRPLKKAEDIAAVPATEPVMIDISDGDVPEKIEVKDGLPEPEKKEPPEIEIELVDPDPEPEIEAKEAPVVDEEKAALQKQIEKLTRAEEDARNRATQAQRESQERQAEVTKYRDDATQAQYESVLNALDASKAESDSAQQAYEAAMGESNFKAAAEAQRRGQRAEAQIVRLEEGKGAFEAALKERQNAPKEKRQEADPVEASIAALPDPAKVWLRTHREYMTDPRKNSKIQALHWDVVDEGHQPFSQGYFDSLETHLGLKAKPATEELREAPVQPKRTMPVSAPVTRDAPSMTTGKPMTTRVTLTPVQREAAKISGISEMEYARQVLKLEQAKKEGHYTESR